MHTPLDEERWRLGVLPRRCAILGAARLKTLVAVRDTVALVSLRFSLAICMHAPRNYRIGCDMLDLRAKGRHWMKRSW